MSQMKPYCFKCGAELDPDAIYCPECGRLQRSMVVRSVDPNAPRAPGPPPPPPGAPPEQPPIAFYPDREPQPAPPVEPYPDQSQPYPDAGWHNPDQVDPYAQQPYADQGWQGDEQADGYAESAQAWPAPAEQEHDTEQAAGNVYAQHEYQEQPYSDPSWSEPGQDAYQQEPAAYDYAQPTGETYEQYQAPGYEDPEPPPPPEPTYTPAERTYTPPEPTYAPAEPVYSSSAPIPGGSHGPLPPPPPSGGYGPPPSRPYALSTYNPGASYGPPSRPRAFRIATLMGAILLGLFLVAFAIGHLLGGGGSAPSAATEQNAQPTAAPTAQPTATPAATPARTATPAQGITGSARFVRVSSSITAKCSTAQGCPVEVVLKNNGGAGSGSVTVTLSDGSNKPLATFTGPIPTTEAGATATVNGYATGEQLGPYLVTGGTVYITSVDVKSGG